MAVESGQSFVIAKSGKPMVKVTAIDAPEEKPKRRIGFAEGLWTVPDDFDTMGQEEIERMFYDGPIFPPDPAAKEPGGGGR